MNNFKIALSLILVLFLSACDDSLEVFEDDGGLYSVHGVLQSQKDISYIRVKDLTVPFTTEATESFNAEVILNNLTTDSIQVLAPIRERFEDIYYYNFAVTNVDPDTEYSLEIKGYDGKFAEHRVKTPDIITHSITPEVRDCESTIRIEFENATDGGNIQLRVENNFIDGGNNPNGIDLTSIDFFRMFYLSSLIKTVEPDMEDPGSPLLYEFKPADTPLFIGNVDCKETGINTALITYIYYSEGLQEKVRFDQLDLIGSTQRFGAVYVGNLVVTF